KPGQAAVAAPVAAVGGLLRDVAAWSEPANVLPLALSAALGAQRRLPAQVAEAVAPAYRNAEGPGGAVTSLALQALTHQDAATSDPLARMQARFSSVLGPLAPIFDPPGATV